jgi:hypothetical protein
VRSRPADAEPIAELLPRRAPARAHISPTSSRWRKPFQVIASSLREIAVALGGGSRIGVRATGRLGWTEEAPFDAIPVAAGGPEAPPALKGQLAVAGQLVIPVGRVETGRCCGRDPPGVHPSTEAVDRPAGA